jgi:tRNA G10  N-methylase Trm11
MYTFEERLHYKKYVTAELTRQCPVYDWYTFPHSFSKEIVHEVLDEFEADQSSVVFDPFTGAGTTLLACRDKGIPAFGIDQLPLAVFITNVKLRDYDTEELQFVLDSFVPLVSNQHCFGSVPTVDKAFSQNVRVRIAAIYGWIQTLPDQQSDFFLLALLYILESISKTAKSGGWLRYVDKEIDTQTVDRLFTARSQKMIDDIESMILPYGSELWYAELDDARYKSEKNGVVDYVISSPPYLNRHDYTRIFTLEMALHFVETNQDLISIRHKALRSHVEAKPQERFVPDSYCPTERLIGLIEDIRSRSKKHDKGRIPSMIKGYFEDVYLTLDSLYNRIVRDGKVAFVLGNVRYAGVMVPVDVIVAEIGEQVGFRVEKIVIARYTGNSAQQMGEFGREPARESIIIWQKEA